MRGRTVFVGDVHGCRDELVALLDRVRFTSGDVLVSVGDLVARGPDSLGVLDVARETGAVIVRGNHEQKLLDGRSGERKAPLPETHRALLRVMRPVDWVLVETSPLWFDLPEHGVRVVHAGVLPGVPIEEQRPELLMNLRVVDDGADRVLWGRAYRGPPHIVFGHNAVAGLQLHRHATGLDTGCVYGRALTALVLDAGEPMPRSQADRTARLVTQPAARVYYDPHTRRPT